MICQSRNLNLRLTFLAVCCPTELLIQALLSLSLLVFLVMRRYFSTGHGCRTSVTLGDGWGYNGRSFLKKVITNINRIASDLYETQSYSGVNQEHSLRAPLRSLFFGPDLLHVRSFRDHEDQLRRSILSTTSRTWLHRARVGRQVALASAFRSVFRTRRRWPLTQ